MVRYGSRRDEDGLEACKPIHTKSASSAGEPAAWSSLPALAKPSGAAHKPTSVDKNRTHIWKPKLHEIASGSMDFGDHEVGYMAQAHWNHVTFRIGELKGLNCETKTINLAAEL